MFAQGVVHQGAQRRAMEMIEVGVCDQNQIDGRKVAHAKAGLAKTLQHKEPWGKIGIDHDILPGHLKKEAGMADEGQSQFAVGNQSGLVRAAGAWRDRGMPYQTAKGLGATTQGGAERGFQHFLAFASNDDGTGPDLVEWGWDAGLCVQFVPNGFTFILGQQDIGIVN
jgi:hypothetical protein